MAKEKIYTHEQVEKLISQAKANIEQLKKDLAERDGKISELNRQIVDYETEKKSVEQKRQENESKSAELSVREAELAPKEKSLSEKQNEIAKKDAEIKAREIALSSQEESFNAIKDSLIETAGEIARKKAELFSAAEKLASDLHEKRIAETEEEVQKIRAAAAAEAQNIRENAEKEVEKSHANAQKQFEDALSQANARAEQVRAAANAESERIIQNANEEAQKITDRAASDTKNLESQISELTKKNAELSGENTRLVAENAALGEDKENLLKELREQKSEFDETTAKYAHTMNSFETLKVQLESNAKDVSEFSREIAGLDIREQELNERENELNERDRKLSFNEKRNENKARTLEEREADIDGEAAKRSPEIIADKDREIEALKKEAESLRNSLFAHTSMAAKFDDLTAQFGGKNPAEVLLDYQRLVQELSIAMEKVNSTPSYALQKQAADLQEKENALNERESALTQKEKESEQFRDDYAQKQAEINELQLKNEAQERDLKIVKEQLERLRSTYENPAEREERIAEINKPLRKTDDLPERMNKEQASSLTEIGWLKNINEKIEGSGLHFPRRILYAFHTALKTSEMSPLTVLAGVSGTGKSELPRLYSRFGGINFLGVPVEPNWDCQEAMLGYYNSIDNCFEPTEMLRILAQSQRKESEQNGLSDVMTMILLDEMNLANVELYFADFLSKLETRRGLSDSEVPYLGVKIGSKMDDWQLRLGRNVLWTGTMNNDETTKTLSDKVLDRGIVISFPRPKELIRPNGKTLLASSPLLLRTAWESWVHGEHGALRFTDEQIEGFKHTVEQINEQLGRTGRALGHRVWQSIESYMSLYPTVISAQSDDERESAMKNAFEDQLVQKVMPKLRGLETRGTQGEVLDKIEGLLPETLRDDFKNAQTQNYGQFIWSTSEYLLRGDTRADKTENADSASAAEIKTEESGDSDNGRD